MININDIKTTTINPQKKKWQRGLSLIEASMVLILSAVVVAGVMSYYQTAQNNNKLEQTLSQTLSIVAGVQGMFTSHNSYAGLTTKAVVQSGYIPSSGISSDKKSVINAYGTVTDIIGTDSSGATPKTGDPSNYVIVIHGLDASQCAKIGSQKIEGSQLGVGITETYDATKGLGATMVKIDDITPVEIASKCKAITTTTRDVVFLMK